MTIVLILLALAAVGGYLYTQSHKTQVAAELATLKAKLASVEAAAKADLAALEAKIKAKL